MTHAQSDTPAVRDEIVRSLARPENYQREDLLQIAQRIVGPGRFVAMVWLQESPRLQKEVWEPDQQASKYAPPASPPPKPSVYRHRWLLATEFDSAREDASRPGRLDPNDPVWMRNRVVQLEFDESKPGPVTEEQLSEALFNLTYVQEVVELPAACVSRRIFLPDPGAALDLQRSLLLVAGEHPWKLDSEKSGLLTLLSTSVDNHIEHRRLRRERTASIMAAEAFDTGSSEALILQKILKALWSSIHFELGLVFVQGPGLLYETRASEPAEVKDVSFTTGSLAAHVADKKFIVRVSEIHDAAERVWVAGTATIDESALARLEAFTESKQAHSWLACPVLDPQGQAIAVIVILNNGSAFRVGQFTATDDRILHRVCTLVGRALPGVRIRHAMEQIDEAFRASIHGKLDGERYNELAKPLSEVIPALTHVWLIPREPALGMNANSPITLLGTVEFEKSRVAAQVDGFAEYRGPDGRAESPIYLHDILPPDEPERRRDFRLVFGLSRPYLSPYEQTIAGFFRSEMDQWLQAAVFRRARLDELFNVRHAIRGRLTQAMTHAMSLYELISPDPRRYRNNLLREADDVSRATGLVCAGLHGAANLLDCARYLHSGVKLDPRDIEHGSVSSVIRDVVVQLKPEAEQFAIELKVRSLFSERSGDDKARFHRGLIEILLFNLVDNAIKYSEPGHPVTVTILATRDRWSVAVEDTGVHIPREKIGEIFQPFVRLAGTPGGRSRTGTGIGLAVAKNIATAHEARIIVSSELRENDPRELAKTTFTFVCDRRSDKGTTE